MSLDVFSENKVKVLSLHGKTQEDIDKDLKILKEWIEKIPHLPQNLIQDVRFLEICLIKNKFSIEKTKVKIENYCTIKSRHKYLLEDHIDTIQPTKEKSFFHLIEPVTENIQRILWSKVYDEDNYDFARDLGVYLAQCELTSRYDYNDGEILIFDYTDLSAQFVTKTRINVFAHAMKLAFKGHSARIKEIRFVNKWAHLLVAFAKPFMPEKLKSRMITHENFDEILKILPKKCIPKDYGGDYKSLQEIREDWDKIFEENREKLKNYYNTMSKEELRTERGDEELQGTFRNLSVD